jgi:hypothetical protein
VNPLLRRHAPNSQNSSPTSLGSRKKKEREKKNGFSGFVSENLPESLLRAFWEKKSQVPELKEIETLGGVN